MAFQWTPLPHYFDKIQVLEFQIWVGNIGYVKKDGRGALIKRQNRILTSRSHFIIKTQHLSLKLAPNPKTVFTLISMGTATGDVTAQKNERTPKDGKRQLCSELCSDSAQRLLLLEQKMRLRLLLSLPP